MERTWDISQLPDAVKSSNCWADVCRALGRPAGGSSQATVIRWATKIGLDVSHFDSRIKRNAGIGKSSKERRIPEKELFVHNSTYPRKLVRNRIIADNLLPYCCAVCNNDGNWMNSTIALHLDHKNGINNDHRLQNLRFLCPNCHSATPTYSGKNRSIIIAP